MILTGNQSAAIAARNAKVDVVAAYPITPATPVLEEISKMVESGAMRARLILVESEHSAMAACIGASATGSRVFTATSSHGLAYMHELLHYAANARTPVVMAVANRAIGPGWNIWADLSDSMSQRDTGWIQVYCESNQEIYDSIVMMYRVAEEVLLPAMVCYDGFVLSHTLMPVEVTDVDGFIGEYEAWELSFDEPTTYGNVMLPEYFMEHRRLICKAHEDALRVMKSVEKEYQEHSGRTVHLIVENYRMDDADIAIVTLGAIASKIAVDNLRERGIKVGLLRIRSFRPFPKAEVLKALNSVEKVYVFDRSVSPGFGGQLCGELRSVLLDLQSPPEVYCTIVGLGGVDVTSKVFELAIMKR